MGGAERARVEVDEPSTIAATPEARRRSISDRPQPPRSVPPSSGQARPGSFADSTARVMRTDETSRALALSRAMAVLSGAGLLVVPIFDRSRVLYFPMALALASLCGASVWMWRLARAGAPSRAALRVYACILAGIGLFVEYDLGVFSPAPLFVVLGVLFLSQSSDRPFAIALPIFCAASYFLLALLVSVGIVPDLGLFTAFSGPRTIRAVMLMMVPAAFLVASWQARQARRATLAAIAETQEALRLALTREAQLAEAHRNLDDALRAGAGVSGRYTGALMGRYRLAEVVGRGAMGEVYAANDTESGRRAAVKVLQASVDRDPDLVERFFREGRIAAKVKSPNIVTMYDVGGGEDGVPYIAMELLEGDDLSSRLRQVERLDLAAVVELVDDVARGLSAAHAAGVVHRDLKPQNIFCAEQGEGQRPTWKILDFGVSKLLGGGATLTRAAIIGTPGYMSPEQTQGHEVDHRSDVFSLAAVAYRALTGRPAFIGEMPQVLFEIVYKNPVRPTELAPGLPREVEHALALALAKRPEQRFDDALDFAAALRAASRGELDPAIRERAEALLAEQPWGAALPGE